MSEPQTRSAEAWSRYWASGELHSCPNAFAGNYDDEIRELWMAFFGRLPDGARVLDIGTGNGAIAFLARDAAGARGAKFHIEAIDAAVIQPAAAASRHGIVASEIVFRGETSCEHTGYPEHYFDALSSQYAVEYSDVDASLVEAARILKPGGHAAFVMHHAASEALLAARAELKSFEFLRRQAPLVVSARRLLRKLATAATPAELAARAKNPDARKELKEIDRLLQRVSRIARTRPHAAFLDGIAAQVAAALQQARAAGPAAALERLASLEAEMEAHQSRLRDISAAGRDRAGIESFCERAAGAGFDVGEPGELLRRGNHLMGWVVQATCRTA